MKFSGPPSHKKVPTFLHNHNWKQPLTSPHPLGTHFHPSSLICMPGSLTTMSCWSIADLRAPSLPSFFLSLSHSLSFLPRSSFILFLFRFPFLLSLSFTTSSLSFLFSPELIPDWCRADHRLKVAALPSLFSFGLLPTKEQRWSSGSRRCCETLVGTFLVSPDTRGISTALISRQEARPQRYCHQSWIISSPHPLSFFSFFFLLTILSRTHIRIHLAIQLFLHVSYSFIKSQDKVRWALPSLVGRRSLALSQLWWRSQNFCCEIKSARFLNWRLESNYRVSNVLKTRASALEMKFGAWEREVQAENFSKREMVFCEVAWGSRPISPEVRNHVPAHDKEKP